MPRLLASTTGVFAIGLLVLGATLFREGVEFTLFEKAVLSGQAVLATVRLVWQGFDACKKLQPTKN